MKQLFLNLFEYDFWANSRTLISLKQFDSPPAKAVELISHITNSQLIWLARIKQHPSEHENLWISESSGDSEVFYKNTKGE